MDHSAHFQPNVSIAYLRSRNVFKLSDLLLGRTLRSSEQAERKMGVVAGVPALGLDGLSSSAYGPEAALSILVPLGAAGLVYIGPIMIVILGLLTILYFSYRQTIEAYPAGGGSYTVAGENLGVGASLLAAAALMIDYVLNVAVGISAGIGALISAFPELQPYTVPLCLATLALITGMNLRGTSEAGRAFAFPTYLFVLCLGIVLVVGISQALASGGQPTPAAAPPALPAAAGTLTLWLLLRSFASGCTAMTGVEAVSNGVNAFAEPAVRNAQRTLTVIVVVLAALLGGIAYLCKAYAIGAMDQTQPDYQSILSQLTAAVLGQGILYYITIGSVLAVLALSANTSFVDFPRLCRLIAHDDFLPRPLTLVGPRLVYSVGIWFLTISSALLLIGFGGVTERLIPLFAVGAFLAFTLSQMGMVRHWQKQLTGFSDADAKKLRPKAIRGLLINAVGAMATGSALTVIIIAKFAEGAWITLLAIPLLLLVFRKIKHHYQEMDNLVSGCGPLTLTDNRPPVILVAIDRWSRLTRKALRFGMRLSPDVVAVHISDLEGTLADQVADELSKRWAYEVNEPAERAGVVPPRLHVIHSQYRRLTPPVLHFVERLQEEHPGRQVAVIIPEMVDSHWWDYFLHNRRAAQLKSALLNQGSSRVVVISVPWHVKDLDDPEPVPVSGAGEKRPE